MTCLFLSNVKIMSLDGFTPQGKNDHQPLSNLNFDTNAFLKENGMEGSIEVADLVEKKKQAVLTVLNQDKAFLKDLQSAVKDGLDREELMPLVQKALANPDVKAMFNEGATEADIKNMVAEILSNPDLPKSGIKKMVSAFSLALATVLALSSFIALNPGSAMAGGDPESGVEQVEQRIDLSPYIRGASDRDFFITEFGGTSPIQVQEALDTLNSGLAKSKGGFLIVTDKMIIFSSGLKRYDAVTREGDWQKEFVYKLIYYLNNRKGKKMYYWSNKSLANARVPSGEKYVEKYPPKEELEKDSHVKKMYAKLAELKELLQKEPEVAKLKKTKVKFVQSELRGVHDLLNRHISELLNSGRELDDETLELVFQVAASIKKTTENDDLVRTSVVDISDQLNLISEGLEKFLSKTDV